MFQKSYTAYSDAPELLMEAIHQANEVLSRMELKTGKTDSWSFWKKKVDVMKYSWDCHKSMEWVITSLIQSKQENNFLRKRNAYLEEVNMGIAIIRSLKIAGNFQETVDLVDKMMELSLENMGEALDG